MRNYDNYQSESYDTENENQKKKFRLFDMNRDGKGVDKDEDRTPNLKFFFKQFARKFTKILQLNLLMIFQVLPLIIIALSYFSGDKTPTVTNLAYAPLYGINTIASSVGGAPILDVSSIQMKIPVFAPLFMIIMIAIALFLIITFGWQNVGAAYVLRGLFRGEAVFVWSDFFYGIKRNFKQGFWMGILDALFIFILGVDFFFFLGQGGTFWLDLMYFVIFAMIIIYMIMRFYIYLLLITFDLKITKIIKNALIFTALGIKRNLLAFLGIILLIALNVALIIIFVPSGFSVPLILPLLYLMGTVGFMTTYAAYPVIDKYMIAPYVNDNDQESSEEE